MLTIEQANVYLGLGPKSEDLYHDAWIPKVDIRKPGAQRAVWRWRKVDLDAFLESRLVRPGQPNPMDNQ